MPSWAVEILDDTVAAEIDAWPRELRAALSRIVDRITSLGLDRVGEPHVRHTSCGKCVLPASARKGAHCT